ncbi:MAG: AAA family ATPase [Planctomycetaceae bacterium]|nr:AAA family ATPase [Planctomycetaceae bacterium]
MKPLYISATLRDCGKTSFSLGLMQLLHDKGINPGYCKPVGQHYVRYHDKNIDEDGVLMHEVFNMKEEPYYLSPIAIESDFTRKFIENPNVKPLEDQILHCHERLSKAHQVLIYEGTGHAGVGSCFGLSNARVAQLLGAKVIIVTAGGIGKPLDEIALSMALFGNHDVEIIGVILNKVIAEKYDKVRQTVEKGLALMGTRLIGAIPYDKHLTTFTLGQLAEEFNYQVLCGHEGLSNIIEETVVAAMEPQNAIKYIHENTLVIMPGDRVDNILIAILLLSRGTPSGGIILTGGFEPHPTIEPLLKSSQIPVLFSNDDTYKVSARMKDLGFKIRSYDMDKVLRLRTLVGEHVDIHGILEALAD